MSRAEHWIMALAGCSLVAAVVQYAGAFHV